MASKKDYRGVNIVNRKIGFLYESILSYTAGIVLLGTEVKSLRQGKVSLADCYCYLHSGEIFLRGLNIPTEKESFTHEPLRDRKLLLHREEIRKIEQNLQPGLTITVKRIFTDSRGKFKADISLARGKKAYDKRESLREKDRKKETRNDT